MKICICGHNKKDHFIEGRNPCLVNTRDYPQLEIYSYYGDGDFCYCNDYEEKDMFELEIERIVRDE